MTGQKLLKIETIPEIKAFSPFVGGQGLLVHDGQVLPIVLTGVLPQEEEK